MFAFLSARLHTLKSRTVRFFGIVTPAVYALLEAGRSEIDLIRDYLPADWSKYLLLVVVAGGIWLRAQTVQPLASYKEPKPEERTL